MLKRLLATTALVAFAASAQAAPATTMDKATAITPAQVAYLNATTPDMQLASGLIGQSVRSGTAEDAPAVGDINDLIVASNGSVDAVVIGVGGFLGMGERNVAVDYDSLTWSTDKDGNRFAVLATTKEDLRNAPEFDVAALRESEVDAGGKPMMAQDQVAAPKAPATGDKVAASPPAAQMPAPKADAMATVDAATVSADSLIDTAVYDAANENVGNVSDVVLTKDGKIDAVVVDVGGFLGLGAKPVAIAFEALDIRKDKDQNLHVYTKFTKDQLEHAPGYDKQAYEGQREKMRLSITG